MSYVTFYKYGKFSEILEELVRQALLEIKFGRVIEPVKGFSRN